MEVEPIRTTVTALESVVSQCPDRRVGRSSGSDCAIRQQVKIEGRSGWRSVRFQRYAGMTRAAAF